MLNTGGHHLVIKGSEFLFLFMILMYHIYVLHLCIKVNMIMDIVHRCEDLCQLIYFAS